MTNESFPNCCGIRIFSGFGYTSTALDSTKYPIEEVEKWIIDNEKQYWVNNNAFIILTLNNEQYEVYKPIMIKLEYKRVRTGYHPQHDTLIHIYIKVLHKEETEKKRLELNQ